MFKPESIAADLPPLSPQLGGQFWPTDDWPRGIASAEVTAQADLLFSLEPQQGVTYALLVIRAGELVFERYDAGANALYMQYSWSMAKSVTHALVGILVGMGKLDLYQPAAVPEWQADARKDITMDQLLRMSSGLAFAEDYVDGQVSDVIPMLMGEGRHDMGAFAANKPALHPPGTHWSYSSGTTNIICRVLRDIVGNGASGMLAFMEAHLFGPLGMRSATPRFDTAGTFIGSSYLFATPQDFARFGYLYLHDGMWESNRILPQGWVDYARTPTYQDDEQAYGAHWWLQPERGCFLALGYDGQQILVAPAQDAVIVRCGRTNSDEIEPIWRKMNVLLERL